MSNMTIKQLKEIQSLLSDAGHDYQVEIDDGKVLIMGPSDITSSEVSFLFSRSLGNWIYPRRLGRVFDSAGGFILPNSDVKAPDISFVQAARLKRTVRSFAKLVPDLVVEVKSQSDRVKLIEEKIRLFLSLGAKIGILIDPDQKNVIIYRPEATPIILRNQDVLTLPDLLPGWELPINEIWPPEFE
ncbi:hypothetical protein C7H19_17325 [Aphanothece hegewaldii CCALA 016]|uniref:Putative restriction endonuclease domain-containing protein n=1 Tax=Aphanothece hegewaldii CCALA 016 TaxID=2107694 RepID=A0A2T1LUH2_9CHRO|nr:Uma2 family endonuclease [Aphanothece hegewaldii]PSF35144.1 hypothetical protein C7H19_17325 [Aphanothece hegewaldii CCALA 016]